MEALCEFDRAADERDERSTTKRPSQGPPRPIWRVSILGHDQGRRNPEAHQGAAGIGRSAACPQEEEDLLHGGAAEGIGTQGPTCFTAVLACARLRRLDGASAAQCLGLESASDGLVERRLRICLGLGLERRLSRVLRLLSSTGASAPHIFLESASALASGLRRGFLHIFIRQTLHSVRYIQYVSKGSAVKHSTAQYMKM